jgi:hypothetical protein
MKTPVDVSYLADTVLMLRYFEAHGAVRRALSVVKKRTGAHESTIREAPEICGGIDDLCRKISETAGIALLAGEALEQRGVAALKEELRRQPPWSDIPFDRFDERRRRESDERRRRSKSSPKSETSL